MMGDGARSSASAGSAPIEAASVDRIASTDIILSPPFVGSVVRFAARRNNNYKQQQHPQPQQQKHANEYYDGVPVDCRLCNGR